MSNTNVEYVDCVINSYTEYIHALNRSIAISDTVSLNSRFVFGDRNEASKLSAFIKDLKHEVSKYGNIKISSQIQCGKAKCIKKMKFVLTKKKFSKILSGSCNKHISTKSIN